MTTAEETRKQEHEQNERKRQENDAKHRGAGSGESAVANRQKKRDGRGNIIEDYPEGTFAEGKSAADYDPDNYKEGSEFPEGDATKGKPDYQARAEGRVEQLPMRDHREYLKDQALKNERANDELNARQVEQNQNFNKAIGLMNDPDFQRDNSMQTALAEADRHTEDGQRKRKDARAKAQQNNANVSDTAAGNNRTVQGTPVPPGTVEPTKR
jgi:hypothetical protein